MDLKKELESIMNLYAGDFQEAICKYHNKHTEKNWDLAYAKFLDVMMELSDVIYELDQPKKGVE